VGTGLTEELGFGIALLFTFKDEDDAIAGKLVSKSKYKKSNHEENEKTCEGYTYMIYDMLVWPCFVLLPMLHGSQCHEVT